MDKETKKIRPRANVTEGGLIMREELVQGICKRDEDSIRRVSASLLCTHGYNMLQ